MRGATSAMGQKAKYSLGVDVFRFTPESGLMSDIAPCPKSANFGSPKAPFISNAEPKRGIEEVCIRLIGCANVTGYSRLMHDDETGDDLQRPCA